jgi:hypothetical protein
MKIRLPENFGTEDDEMFDRQSPPGSVLSADAAPFHPTYEPVNIAIYNDGVPELVLTCEKDRAEILHGIQDEAIDEGFHLDAFDAAELEATEAFVWEMANLALMEEREEQARHSFNHIKKRWEARRAAGPSGRPRPAMNLIIPTEHVAKRPSKCNSIVSYGHAHRMLVQEDKMRTMEIKNSTRIEPRVPKTNIMKPRHPIQQPRKYA